MNVLMEENRDPREKASPHPNSKLPHAAWGPRGCQREEQYDLSLEGWVEVIQLKFQVDILCLG